jgi:hypothetical protein
MRATMIRRKEVLLRSRAAGTLHGDCGDRTTVKNP